MQPRRTGVSGTAHTSRSETRNNLPFTEGSFSNTRFFHLFSEPGSAMITNVETPTIIHSPSEFCQTSPGPEPNLYPSAKTRTRKRKIAPTPHGNNAFGRLGCRRCVQCRKWKQKVPPAHSSGLSQSVYMTPKTFSYLANSAVTEALRAARTIKSLVRLA